MKTNGIETGRESNNTARPSPWFKPREAADYLRRSVKTLDKNVAEGKLCCFRGDEDKSLSTRYFHIMDLDAFIILGHPKSGRRLLPEQKQLLEMYSQFHLIDK